MALAASLATNAASFSYYILQPWNQRNFGEKALAWAATIILGIFSLGIIQGASALYLRLTKNKCLSVIDNKSKATFQNIINTSIKKIGGFKRERNTCFIAATLQIIRHVPEVRNRLNSSHPIKDSSENVEKFNMRLAIKNKLSEMLEMTDCGQTLEASSMEMLHELLHNYSSSIAPPGQMGDINSVVSAISNVLEIRKGVIYNKIPDDIFVNNVDPLELVDIKHCSILECSYPLNGYEGIILTEEPRAHYELEGPDGEAIKFALAGAITASNHAIAYSKNSKGWTRCNDADITHVSKFPTDVKMAYLFYKKVIE